MEMVTITCAECGTSFERPASDIRAKRKAGPFGGRYCSVSCSGAAQRRRGGELCSVDGCEGRRVRRGWCDKHYEQWRHHGDPLHVRTYPRRRLRRQGYIAIKCPDHPAAMADGYVLEHRKVWWDACGPILPGYVVHHKNGDRTDNRLENLELLTKSEHDRLHAEQEKNRVPPT